MVQGTEMLLVKAKHPLASLVVAFEYVHETLCTERDRVMLHILC